MPTMQLWIVVGVNVLKQRCLGFKFWHLGLIVASWFFLFQFMPHWSQERTRQTRLEAVSWLHGIAKWSWKPVVIPGKDCSGIATSLLDWLALFELFDFWRCSQGKTSGWSPIYWICFFSLSCFKFGPCQGIWGSSAGLKLSCFSFFHCIFESWSWCPGSTGGARSRNLRMFLCLVCLMFWLMWPRLQMKSWLLEWGPYMFFVMDVVFIVINVTQVHEEDDSRAAAGTWNASAVCFCFVTWHAEDLQQPVEAGWNLKWPGVV